jgi:PTH1 family peptidyl-tRNA hydrolase
MNDAAPWLLVGLGNPGAKYAGNRHNVGFMAVERWADRFATPGADEWREKFHARTMTLSTLHGRVVVLQPQTYMNRSGASVAAAAKFFHVPAAKVIVAHDEIDFVLGRVAVKQGGGHGGHNGLRDLIAQLGAGFWRLRLGVGHPGNKDQVIDYVLERPPTAERELIEAALARGLDLVPALLAEGAQKAMQALHTRAGERT